jgi:transporter family protein
MSWLAYALISAAAAAATAILAKLGVEGVPSAVATAIRTVVVAIFAWAIVFGIDEQRAALTISRRTLIFLVLSGLATGVSWLAYFRALQMAEASSVAPIDKLSLPLTLVFASLVLGETFTWPRAIGVALMVAGALITTRT